MFPRCNRIVTWRSVAVVVVWIPALDSQRAAVVPMTPQVVGVVAVGADRLDELIRVPPRPADLDDLGVGGGPGDSGRRGRREAAAAAGRRLEVRRRAPFLRHETAMSSKNRNFLSVAEIFLADFLSIKNVDSRRT